MQFGESDKKQRFGKKAFQTGLPDGIFSNQKL
jgi:hypothetical protein